MRQILIKGFFYSLLNTKDKKLIQINKNSINCESRPYIVAEMSGNHNQSLEAALEIVDYAALSGASAIKIQTYTPDTMTLNLSSGAFKIDDAKSLWSGSTLYDLYQKGYTPWEWHKEIFDRAKLRGIDAFSSPFDISAVNFLEELNAPCYKIASFENTDIPLIRRVAQTGKPVIISSGMASVGEISEAINTIRNEGNEQIILLKCTSTYPANPVNSNLRTIPHMRSLFNCEVGLSDHTLGIGAAIAAVALGATFIEKHFTLNRAAGGIDSAFSLEPHELRSLVDGANTAWNALGSVQYGPLGEEIKSLQFRRSIYVAEDMKAGEILNTKNMRIIRPGFGLEPKYFDLLLGKSIKLDIKRGTPLSWDLVL